MSPRQTRSYGKLAAHDSEADTSSPSAAAGSHSRADSVTLHQGSTLVGSGDASDSDVDFENALSSAPRPRGLRVSVEGFCVTIAVVSAALSCALTFAVLFGWIPMHGPASAPQMTVQEGYVPPTCSGPCCSASSPRLPPGTPVLPSTWWTTAFYEGSQVQLRAEPMGKWVGPQHPGKGWGSPGAYHDVPEAADFFTVERVGPAHVRLRTPADSYLSAEPSGVVRGTQLSPYNCTVFSFSEVPGSSPPQVRLMSYEGKYVVLSPIGALRHAFDGPDATGFAVREVMSMPAFRGVGLPGWLVTEAWIRPDLYLRVPFYMDGMTFKLQSIFTGKYVTVRQAQLPTILRCSADKPGDWETFHLRTITGSNETHKHQIRSFDHTFWTTDDAAAWGDLGNPGSADDASSPNKNFVYSGQRHPSNDMSDTFRLHFHPDAPNYVMIQAGDGNFLAIQDDDEDSVTASVPASKIRLGRSSPHWSGKTAFLFIRTSAVRGEWQLGRYFGVEEAQKELEEHRGEWVREEDFARLQVLGLNAVRVPVGYWLVEEAVNLDGVGGPVGPSYPFTSGGLKYLDKAFEWGSKYGLRVFLSMHGAPGSQNGFEHSGSRDGIADWANNEANIDATVNAVDFLAQRYGSNPAFAGINVLNEPLAEGVPLDKLVSYYSRAYEAVRKHSVCAFVAVMSRVGAEATEMRDAFSSPSSGGGGSTTANDTFSNVILEEHFYNIFYDANATAGASYERHMAYVASRRDVIAALQSTGRPAMVGEWSLAMYGDQQVDANDTAAFAAKQAEVYGGAQAGWFYFSHKMPKPIWAHFGLFEGVQREWIHADSFGVVYG